MIAYIYMNFIIVISVIMIDKIYNDKIKYIGQCIILILIDMNYMRTFQYIY